MHSDRHHIIKIAITGPESTGKSTLCKHLAYHYRTTWVPEFAREYIGQLNRPYQYEDLLEIAKGQFESQRHKLKYTDRYLICDTELLVIKIWSEHKYGKVDPFILREYQKQNFDLYLLSDIDLPWKFDPQREHPDKRQFFFKWFEKELKAKQANYRIISGKEEERLQMAIHFIEQIFNKS